MQAPLEQSPSDEEQRSVPRWVEGVVGLALALVLVFCLAGSLMLVFMPNEKAPVLAPIFGIGMTLVALWGFLVCFRLVTGRKVRGGLMSPPALRAAAWFFLLLPVGGVFTGYFITNTLQALVMTGAYISVFFGLRRLASRRERHGA